jgi:TatA/E family protein of Tat protein translocase
MNFMAAEIVAESFRSSLWQKRRPRGALPVFTGGSMMRGMGTSFPDMIFLFLLALVVFGPKKLPEIGRQVGKLLNELKRASNEFKAQIQTEMDNMEQQESATKMLAPGEPPPGAVAALSLKPHPVADSEAYPGEAVDLKPIDGELTDPKPVDPEPIVIHPIEGERSNEAEGSGPVAGEFNFSESSEAANNHHPDSAIKATNA